MFYAWIVPPLQGPTLHRRSSILFPVFLTRQTDDLMIRWDQGNQQRGLGYPVQRVLTTPIQNKPREHGERFGRSGPHERGQPMSKANVLAEANAVGLTYFYMAVRRSGVPGLHTIIR